MSLKFRLAFKDTFGIWFPCLKPGKLQEFNYSTVGPGVTVTGPDYTNSIKFQNNDQCHKQGSIGRMGNGDVSMKPSASCHQLAAFQKNKVSTHAVSLELNSSPRAVSHSCTNVYNHNNTGPSGQENGTRKDHSDDEIFAKNKTTTTSMVNNLNMHLTPV